MPTYFSLLLLKGRKEIMGMLMLSELKPQGRHNAVGRQNERKDGRYPVCGAGCACLTAAMLPHAEIKAGCCFRTPMPMPT